MADPFLGQLALVPYNFTPHGWAFAQGQLLPISQNTALFSLLGTTYGGDGKSTFALPDLQGRVPVGAGQGPGLSLVDLGEEAGEQNFTLLDTEVPPHAHSLQAADGRGIPLSTSPAGAVFAKQAAATFFAPAANLTQQLAGAALPSAGSSQPHDNMMPYLTLNYIIALQGVFPARS